ncbi:hypothetical protein [Robertmurraya massiliosenegalensis]|uniref:hypothetical protein n=1 Tax=Robertmurraya massiliosenegalensis TaxID=1287657 RepID=UPI00037AB8EA|nr:hypothetical protein [Robertmurraya massiliosenegalensis]
MSGRSKGKFKIFLSSSSNFYFNILLGFLEIWRVVISMYIVLLTMLIAACIVLFFCGYYVAVIRLRLGKNALLFAPIVIALFMFNVIMALVELSHSPNWQ